MIGPVVLDETYLDVTENRKGLPTATAVARTFCGKIPPSIELNTLAGMSYNKFIAKVVSGCRKPDVLYVISHHCRTTHRLALRRRMPPYGT